MKLVQVSFQESMVMSCLSCHVLMILPGESQPSGTQVSLPRSCHPEQQARGPGVGQSEGDGGLGHGTQ